MSELRVGISGWRYAPWRGDFYPPGLKQKNELAYASRAVNCLEINGSFYALQTPERYAKWRDATPDDFIFSVKGPRFITHSKRLNAVEQPLANFFASGVLALQHKLGPILWQFPPRFSPSLARLNNFLNLLPRTQGEAAQLAQRSKRGGTPAPHKHRRAQPLRHALEIRSHDALTPDLVALLRDHQVALVVSDGAIQWPCVEEVTADFLYLRLHGDKALYQSGYSEQALEGWKKRLRIWRQGKQPADAHLLSKRRKPSADELDIYCFFDNDMKVHAPFNAYRLLEKLRLTSQLEVQPGKMPDHIGVLAS